MANKPTGGNIKKAGEFLLKNYYKYNPPIDTDNFGMEHARLQRFIALDMDEGKPIQEIMKGHRLKKYIQEGVNNNGEVTTLIMGGKKTKRKGKRKTRKRRKIRQKKRTRRRKKRYKKSNQYGGAGRKGRSSF